MPFRLILAASLALAILPSSATAEKYDWQRKSKFSSVIKEIKKKKEIPTKIECKMSDKPGVLLFKVTTQPNKKNQSWEMGIYDGKLWAGNKKSVDVVVQPKSGMVTTCWLEHN
ncbi:hypothetical protein [Roseibium suaedae]|uniref:DUF2541 family protein n=1 Tax=Roseibium suaedae TaxID=735517 RepID=A0A1M7PEL3_9HYPH|nr:hypothetical protein [Roseibium suaedae]SHN15056.1 hypothetical protein SAMN05444272_4334 [Roseibium suaedae]